MTKAELARFQGSAPLLGLHVTHGARGVHNSAGSFNWAGYAAISKTPQFFTSVIGTWTVPAVTCTSEDRLTSEWVGLDGASDSTVEQDGTTSQCFEGKALYDSWYEMYPAGSKPVGTKVKPGDVITASVVRVGKSYTLKLTDATTAGNNISKTASCALATCLDESAEWITERPEYATTGIVPEAQFAKPVSFSHGSATGGGTTGVISSQPGLLNITCIDSTQTYEIVSTSALGSSGSSFTNTWKNSY